MQNWYKSWSYLFSRVTFNKFHIYDFKILDSPFQIADEIWFRPTLLFIINYKVI